MFQEQSNDDYALYKSQSLIDPDQEGQDEPFSLRRLPQRHHVNGAEVGVPRVRKTSRRRRCEASSDHQEEGHSGAGSLKIGSRGVGVNVPGVPVNSREAAEDRKNDDLPARMRALFRTMPAPPRIGRVRVAAQPQPTRSMRA